MKIRKTIQILLVIFLCLNMLAGCARSAIPEEAKAGEQLVQTLHLNRNLASMTEKRTFDVSFELPQGVKAQDLIWTYGGKPLSEWKKDLESGDDTSSFITVGELKQEDQTVYTSVTFDLPYGMETLAAGRLQSQPFLSMVGTFDLAVSDGMKVIASEPIELLPFDSYCTYDGLTDKIKEITDSSLQGRYIDTRTIGHSAAGRDIYMTIVARDEESINNYENEIIPLMLEKPELLQQDIQSGKIQDYQVPVFINNIHPNEAPGVCAIVKFLKEIATQNELSYALDNEDGSQSQVNMKVEELLKHVFFLLVYTDNPDGFANAGRLNGNEFDLNRDNSYQTQSETQSVTEQIAKWCPVTFLDLHGYEQNFLIEPCTPPHNPNLEYDLLMDSLLKQAQAMGSAAISNTKYDGFYIPYVEYQKKIADPEYAPENIDLNWDDASANFTAVFSMYHGALGHTIEIPEMNEQSTDALVYCVEAAANYVSENKEELFLNQLEIFRRGVNNIDDLAVDQYLVDKAGQVVGREREMDQNFFPEYYILPMDEALQKNPLEVYHMLEYFLRNGVKAEVSTEEVMVDGRLYKPGTYVIDMHQANHGLANLVLYKGIDLSREEYISATAVQDFPVLRGFDCYSTGEGSVFDGKTKPVNSIVIPGTELVTDAENVIIRNTNNDAIKAVNKLLADSKDVRIVSETGKKYEAGGFIVSAADLRPIANNYYLELLAVEGDVPVGKKLAPLKVTIYGEGSAVLKDLGFCVTDSEEDGDILINTFDPATALTAGKAYIAYGNMGMYNLSEVMPELEFSGPDWMNYEGVFRVDVNQDNNITACYDSEEFFYSTMASYITNAPDTAQILLTISDEADFYKSGWWPEHEIARGQILAFTCQDNEQKIAVFATDLINSAHSQNQYRLLANTIFDFSLQ